MPYEIDQTHDPKLESWVESANDPGTDFPIQNLPLCLIEIPGGDEVLATRIGDRYLNIAKLASSGMLDDLPDVKDLCGLMSVAIYELGGFTPHDRQALRKRLSEVLSKSATPLTEDDPDWKYLYAQDEVEHLGWSVSDYTDFYASVFHATNVGSMFRPTNPLLPNYKHIPIAYHGRASTIVPSGSPIIRPRGQQAPAEEGGDPTFGPCKLLDYELEVGVVVGRGNVMGEPISIQDAEDHILGLCLVNDWSARDLQKWEYQPLGPFLAKSFATTVSPYIVTMEALAPFRTPAYERPAGDPAPMPYLTSDHNTSMGGVDLTLEVFIASEQMRAKGMDPVRLSKGSFKDMYWTIAQMLTHHSSNGCAMNPGDLLASGTVSGPERSSRGCLLELTWDGNAFSNPPELVPTSQRTPVELPSGESRKFLEDGDEIILKGYCERDGYRRIGFGECRGIIAPSPT